jgi:hypothetical protein
VPLDYSDPKGRKAAIALIRKPATNKENYRGPVSFNPGGPGGSGVDLIQSIGDALSIILGDGFDIVSFDPRGKSFQREKCDAAKITTISRHIKIYSSC